MPVVGPSLVLTEPALQLVWAWGFIAVFLNPPDRSLRDRHLPPVRYDSGMLCVSVEQVPPVEESSFQHRQLCVWVDADRLIAPVVMGNGPQLVPLHLQCDHERAI
jgi:hypothetical protein